MNATVTPTRKFRKDDGSPVSEPTQVSEEVSKKTREYAMKIEEELKDLLNDDLGPRYWRKCELMSLAHEKNIWQIRGFETERAWREAMFISRASWYQKMRNWNEWAAMALDKDVITRARLNRMPSQNVKQLLRLEVKQRFAQKWIERALALKETDMEAAVDAFLENDGDETAADSAESYTLLKFRCTVAQKQFVLDGLQEFAKAQKPELPLDDEAGILEKLIASWLSGPRTPEEQEELVGA